MMQDPVARAMAMDAAKNTGSGGGTVDAYTRAQVDAKLAEKADRSEVAALETAQSEQAEAISAVAEQAALNRSAIGLRRKNLLKVSLNANDLKGVHLSVENNGVINVSGISTGASDNLVFKCVLPNKELILTGCPKGGGEGTYRLRVGRISPENSTFGVFVGGDIGSGYKFTPDGVSEYTITIQIFAGFGEGLVLKPMLRYAEITDDTYEPYVDDLQTQIEALPKPENTLTTKTIVSGGKGDDFNDFIETGIYRYQGGPKNYPINGTITYGILQVIRYEGYVLQIAFSGLTNGTTILTRGSTDSGENWSEWKKQSAAESVIATSDSVMEANAFVMDTPEIAEENTIGEETNYERTENL